MKYTNNECDGFTFWDMPDEYPNTYEINIKYLHIQCIFGFV